MKIYLDSSALVKRYIKEKGSDKVFKTCSEADQIFPAYFASLK